MKAAMADIEQISVRDIVFTLMLRMSARHGLPVSAQTLLIILNSRPQVKRVFRVFSMARIPDRRPRANLRGGGRHGMIRPMQGTTAPVDGFELLPRPVGRIEVEVPNREVPSRNRAGAGRRF